MSQKWKSVLTNWINCFFEDNDIKENINIESLSKVVKYLQKNFCPDETNSSLLEATTLEEFIKEKYPVFTFETGAVQIASETDVYYAASLLLFFVCVNSKDANIKNAICKNLNDEQQEMVLKFNKCLMECSSITYKEVEIAILDACGKNSSLMELPNSLTETPPVLRSLHNEVQRLRAALDAERFDKNYLQEELGRTNSTLTKVSKERDKYKEEILMLNSRIASDFEENQMQTQSSARKQMNAKLKRQLEELEQRLLDTQLVLEEVQNECETYKSKVEDLQVERDKWVVFGKTESSKVQQLTQHLEKEKSERESLLQLVFELRQYNKQNGLDSSQLECDDPDVSVHSIGVSSLTCNEVCANVVEVQLGEERARITALTENLQALQDQIQLLKETTSKEKITLETKLLEKTTEYENLKQQLNFEIKENIRVTENKNNEINKLSVQLSELQQTVNDIVLNSKHDLESKMKEIQTLQEEKISLIESFTNKVTRMENTIQEKDLIIQNIKINLNTELESNLKLKDEYDTHILDLNQKVSAMDREVVDLQNMVLEKTYEIKSTKISLQKQTELYQNLELEHSALQADFKVQQVKLQEICRDLKDKNEALECFNEKLKKKDHEIHLLNENCSGLTEIQEKLLKDIEELNVQKHSLEAELNNTQSMFSDEKNELEMALSQKDAALAILSLDLEQEIKIKKELLYEISQLKNNNHDLSLEIEKKKLDLKNINIRLNDKIEELKSVVITNENLEQSVKLLKTNKQELIEKLKEKTDELLLCESNYKSVIEQLENSKTAIQNDYKVIEAQLSEERARVAELLYNLETLQCQIKRLEETAIKERTILEAKLLEQNKEIENLRCQIQSHINERVKLAEHSNDEISKLNNQVNDMEQKMTDVLKNSTHDLESRAREIHTLKEEKNMLIHNFTTEIAKMERAIKDRDITIHNIQVNLDTETNSKLKLREDYDKHIVHLNQKLSNRNNEVVELQTSLLERSDETESSKISLHKQIKMYHDLEVEYSSLKLQFDNQQHQLQQIHNELEDKSKDIECLNGKLHESEQVISQITSKHSELTEIHSKVLKEFDDVNIQKTTLEVELKNARNAFCEEQQELKMVLTQKDLTLTETSLELEKEINLKGNLLKQLSQLKDANQKLSSEVEQENSVLEEIRSTLKDEYQKFEKVTTKNKNLEQSIARLKKQNEELIDELRKKCDEKTVLEANNEIIVSQLLMSKEELQKKILLLQQQIVDIEETYKNILTVKEFELKQVNEKLAVEKKEKVAIQNAEFEIHKLQDELMKSKEEYEVKLQEIKDHQSIEHSSLKSQIKLLEETATKEKIVLETKILEKTVEIDNLTSQIKEKTKLIQENNAEISKLNSQLNETELKINGILQNNSCEIENKIKEIQILQEDKLTLLQNHTAEIVKLENIIKNKDILIQNIEVALDTEVNAKYKLKEQYDEQMNVLAEKISHSNNEVVELRNTLLSRNNEIESTKISLQKQIKMYQDLETEYSTYKLNYEKQQTRLQELYYELETKSKTLECLNEKLLEDKEKISQLTERCSELSAIQTKLSKEIGDFNDLKNSLEMELKNVQNTFFNKRCELETLLSQKDLYLVEVSSNLEREINHKAKLLNEVSQLNDTNRDLSSQLEQKTKELEKMLSTINDQIIENENVISANKNLEQTIIALKKDKEELMTKLKDKCEELTVLESNKTVTVEQLEQDKAELQKENGMLKQKVEDTRLSYENIITEKDLTLKRLSEELNAEKSGKTAVPKNVEMEIQKLHDEILKSNQETKFKLQEIKGLHSGEYSLLKTVFRELTNLSDASADSDVDSKRSLNSGTISSDKLEKSLETKEHHLRKYNEKQIALQKERDKLAQLCRSNEADLVNVKKFLAELCVYITTFKSVREIYTQKLSKVVSLQRIARREIHNLEGKLSDSTICKLERHYAAIMQDLTEFIMNMERWTAKSVEAGLTSETIKRAFKSPTPSFCSGSLQNGSMNIQLDELNLAFQKLLEEISLIPSEEMARESRASNMMEIRAEYEDKLNRMKKKMKELYQEQIGIFRERQKEEIAILEKELMAAREKLAESSKAYEEHIRGLTTELWSVGEKFLMKKDEADWLRRRQHSGSLMSLQQMHSSGITSVGDDRPRASDTHSLRSLQPTRKTDRRGFHMSDEEGEVFDNRCLRELHDTPPANPELRLSELRWRNSLCPPHLKSSYPAETQFAPSLDEDDIKSIPGGGGGRQRKEVGITAYKKPGPPTPSKQAGRLSATDSELRESLRTEAEMTARKTSTPSRLRALFRRHDTDNSNTPRNKRLSIFRSKK